MGVELKRSPSFPGDRRFGVKLSMVCCNVLFYTLFIFVPSLRERSRWHYASKEDRVDVVEQNALSPRLQILRSPFFDIRDFYPSLSIECVLFVPGDSFSLSKHNPVFLDRIVGILL